MVFTSCWAPSIRDPTLVRSVIRLGVRGWGLGFGVGLGTSMPARVPNPNHGTIACRGGGGGVLERRHP